MQYLSVLRRAASAACYNTNQINVAITNCDTQQSAAMPTMYGTCNIHILLTALSMQLNYRTNLKCHDLGIPCLRFSGLLSRMRIKSWYTSYYGRVCCNTDVTYQTRHDLLEARRLKDTKLWDDFTRDPSFFTAMATDQKIRDFRTKLIEGTVPTHILPVPHFIVLILLRTGCRSTGFMYVKFIKHNLRCLVLLLSLQLLV